MKCDLCEEEKHCIAIDIESITLTDVCEECWDKFCEENRF